MAEVVQRLGPCVDPSTVADGVDVDPVLVDIAVENLAPITAAGKADLIVEAIGVPEMHDHDHVVALSLHPAVKREHAILIVNMHNAETLTAQARIAPAKFNELPRETHMIQHLLVACVESGPVQQQVLVKLEVIRPLFILEKLLAHEQHRDAGRG